MEKIALVILNGEAPEENLLRDYWKKADFKICADGGANILYKYQLKPNLILGDLDSINKESTDFFKTVTQIKIKDQNTTDGEKALIYLRNSQYETVYILGAGGLRMDHLIYNLELLKKFYHPKQKIYLISDYEKSFLITAKTRIKSKAGKRISILPIYGKAINIQTKGLKYQITEKSMEAGVFSSISNVLVQNEILIDIEKGCLLICLEL